MAARNISRLQDAARKVADGNFETTIPVASVGQLGQLARTFNEMQRRLAELDSARKQFIANASHELRTPIFSLGGFVELLEEEDPSPEERDEFVRTMRQQIERLTKLTTDLLDLSQLDAGAMVMSRAQRRPRRAGPRGDPGVRRPRRTARLAPAAAHARAPAIARADPDRVRQIIRILLDNALTHTPEGTKVTVTTYSVNRRAELTVSDEGSGIPQRVQSRIFERFYTADKAGGSGLGLAIATELAQRMDGRITISSSRRFTAFTLDLPPAQVERAGSRARLRQGRHEVPSRDRGWFAKRDFVEVETAALQISPGNETHLHAFATDLIGPDGKRQPFYLRTSPEFACKKLLAAGERRSSILRGCSEPGTRRPASSRIHHAGMVSGE